MKTAKENNKNKIIAMLMEHRTIFAAYILVIIFGALHQYNHSGDTGAPAMQNYAEAGEAFACLTGNSDFGTNEFSPAVSALLAPLQLYPDVRGFLIWSLLNAFLLFYAVKLLPLKNRRITSYILWFTLAYTFMNIQSSQEFGLAAALIILTYVFFENGNSFVAAIFAVLGFYLNIIGVAAALLFLLYPHKGKFALSLFFWTAALGLLPVAAAGFERTFVLYGEWFVQKSGALGTGVESVTDTLLGIQPGLLVILLSGILMLGLPFIRTGMYENIKFRFLLLASVLVWTIIFNYRAESPVLIMAASGAAIWFYIGRRQMLNIVLFAGVFVLTALPEIAAAAGLTGSPVAIPLYLKAMLLMMLWAKIIFDLLFHDFRYVLPMPYNHVPETA